MDDDVSEQEVLEVEPQSAIYTSGAVILTLADVTYAKNKAP